MIIGVGTDIIEVARVCKACEKSAFLKRCYTEKEQQLIEQKKGSAATNFAAKEAVSKVFGTGFREFTMKDIEVLRDELGKPYVVLHNKASDAAKALGISRIHISLSDCSEYATAFAVGEGEISCTF